MIGRVKALREDFGFIVSAGGAEFFFHRDDVLSSSTLEFEDLAEGDRVSFEVVQPAPERGPRAAAVVWEVPR